MPKEDRTYLFFITALEDILKHMKSAVEVALNADVSEAYISQIRNRKRQAGFKGQVKIANACGYEYLEFLKIGKMLTERKHDFERLAEVDLSKANITFNNSTISETKPTPMDPAIQLLQEALEETGVKINEKQKQAVLKILREELEKAEGKTKDDIKKYLEAFGR